MQQVGSVDGYAVAMLRLVTITTPTQVIGEDPVIACQVVGKRLKTKSVGCEAMHTDDRWPLLTPLDIMQFHLSRGHELIAYWIHQHRLLLAVGSVGGWTPFCTVASKNVLQRIISRGHLHRTTLLVLQQEKIAQQKRVSRRIPVLFGGCSSSAHQMPRMTVLWDR